MQRTAIVVDDSRVARMTLKKLLITANFDVVEFGSAEEVLDYLQSSQVKPDIIFMDVMMGGMDGLTATKKIKEDPQLHSIPVVMCTGNDTQEDRQKAVDVGAITALSKPPIGEALADILVNINKMPKTSEPERAMHFNEAELIAKILATIEQRLLPDIEKSAREKTENISRQIAQSVAENRVNQQIKEQLEKSEHQLTQQLTQKAEAIMDESAQQACKVAAEDVVLDAAMKSVQVVIEEADLPAQISEFFAKNGEEWLTEQEEELGSQLSTQLEQLIPSMVSQRLDDTLESTMTPIVEQLVTSSAITSEPQADDVENKAVVDEQYINQLISHALHQHTTTVFQPLISATISKRFAESDPASNELVEQLSQQVTSLKTITTMLGIAVVGLLIAVIF